jgi:hypothetical protein
LLLLALLFKDEHKRVASIETSSNRGVVDKITSMIISRKMKVFFIGSIALFRGFLESGDWVVISTAYIATRGITDIVERIYISKR